MKPESLRSQLSVSLVCLAGLGIAVGIVGCGSGGHGTAPVKGKVTYDGKPVTGGNLTFAPLGGGTQADVGKPASGDVQSDGSYTLTTYMQADGAVIGKHRVSYSAPTVETPEYKDEDFKVAEDGTTIPPEPPPAGPFEGLIPKQTEVEVKAGENQIDVELVKPAGR